MARSHQRRLGDQEDSATRLADDNKSRHWQQALSQGSRTGDMPSNPRSANGNLRRKYRARMKAAGERCGICGGRLGPIHYDEPSDSNHPLSFVIDEIHPISRWQEFGYASSRAAAEDWTNLQAAHYCCNAMKSNKTAAEMAVRPGRRARTVQDGQW